MAYSCYCYRMTNTHLSNKEKEAEVYTKTHTHTQAIDIYRRIDLLNVQAHTHSISLFSQTPVYYYMRRAGSIQEYQSRAIDTMSASIFCFIHSLLLPFTHFDRWALCVLILCDAICLAFGVSLFLWLPLSSPVILPIYATRTTTKNAQAPEFIRYSEICHRMNIYEFRMPEPESKLFFN